VRGSSGCLVRWLDTGILSPGPATLTPMIFLSWEGDSTVERKKTERPVSDGKKKKKKNPGLSGADWWQPLKTGASKSTH